MPKLVIPGGRLARDAVREFNKYLLNPVMLRLAGRRYWYAGVIHHTGRRSGRAYATPVVADPIDGGFVVPLPYGTEVDWLRNVLAAGEATLDVGGRSVAVTDPQVLDADKVLPLLPAGRARRWRVWRIERFLRVTTRSTVTAG